MTEAPVAIDVVNPLQHDQWEVAIVMPTYNQYQETKKNIDLIKQQTVVPDIIVVDNDSSDWTFEKLKKAYKDIVLIQSWGNYGSWWWQYLGQKYAYEQWYQWIILNDNDAYPVDDDLIESLLDSATTTVSPQPLNSAEQTQDINKDFIYTLHYNIYHRSLIEEAWFVDHKLFIYGDEVDYHYRTEKQWLVYRKISSRYYHPLKSFYPAKLLYFLTRNSLYRATIYANFFEIFVLNVRLYLGNIVYWIMRNLSYYFRFYLIGCRDALISNFSRNQQVISSQKNDAIAFQFSNIQEFVKLYNRDKALFSLKEVFNGKIISKRFWVNNVEIPRKEIFWKKILITNGFNSIDRAILSLAFERVVFVKDIDRERERR